MPPTWIQLEDRVEVDRFVYYNPKEDRIQWEPKPPAGTVEKFSDERHGAWRIMAGVAQNTARNSRETKLINARAYYERREWLKASVQFDKAIAAGCGRHAAAMRDNAHAKFVLWETSDGDPELLAEAVEAHERSFGLGFNEHDPSGLLMGARLRTALGDPAGAMRHLFNIMAIRYHGDFKKPSRAWTVEKEIDELTVRMHTTDLDDLPTGARVQHDGKTAVLVCRKANVTDHSTSFGAIEACVLHAAWALDALGARDGALKYLDYLGDVPPEGVPGFVIPLLAGLLQSSSGDLFGALCNLEAAQALHAETDASMGLPTPREWFGLAKPWRDAAPALATAGFPAIASACYFELSQRLLQEEESEEEEDDSDAEEADSDAEPEGAHHHHHHHHHRRHHNKVVPDDVMYQLAVTQMLGGRSALAISTMAKLIGPHSPSKTAKWAPKIRATATKWKPEPWGRLHAAQDVAAVVLAKYIRRFVARRRLAANRKAWAAHLVRTAANAEVLANHLLSATGRGTKRMFKAWFKVVKDRKKRQREVIVLLQCTVRMFLGRRRAARVAARRDMLRYAFRQGGEARGEALVRRCFSKLGAWVHHQKAVRATVTIQRVGRGYLGRRKAKLEKVVLFMRGRGGRWLLVAVFNAWSLPKKNRKRRLAAGSIQRHWRGFTARKVLGHLRAAKHRAESRILEVCMPGKLRLRRECFEHWRRWPAMRPTYEAAVRIQRVVRGRSGRKHALGIKVATGRAKASLGKALGFGRDRTLRRTFRALRFGKAAKVVQRAWRSLQAYHSAQRTLALLRRRRAKIRRFMASVLGEAATRALYAWYDYTEAMWVTRHACADVVGRAWRCAAARHELYLRRRHHMTLEEVGGRFFGATGHAWRRTCFRAWSLARGPLGPEASAGPHGAAGRLRWAEAQDPVDKLWVQLVHTKAALVLQTRMRGSVTKRRVAAELRGRRQRKHLFNRVFGSLDVRAQALAFRRWLTATRRIRAAVAIQCLFRVARSLRRAKAAKAAVAHRRRLIGKVLDFMTSDFERTSQRLYLGHWARTVVEHRAAGVILRACRVKLALNRGRRHAAALFLFSALAMQAALVRRRRRDAAASVAGRALRRCLAQRRLRALRATATRNGEKVFVSRRMVEHRLAQWAMDRWTWAKKERHRKALILQCAVRCARGAQLLKRRLALRRLEEAREATCAARVALRRLRLCFSALEAHAVDLAHRRTLALPLPHGFEDRLEDRRDAVNGLDKDPANNPANNSDGPRGPDGDARRSLRPLNAPKDSPGWRGRAAGAAGAAGRKRPRLATFGAGAEAQPTPPAAPLDGPLLVRGHDDLVAWAVASGRPDGVGAAYHDARARVHATGCFVWSPPRAQASARAGAPSSPRGQQRPLTRCEGSALAFEAAVVLVERPDAPTLRRLEALLHYRIGAAERAHLPAPTSLPNLAANRGQPPHASLHASLHASPASSGHWGNGTGGYVSTRGSSHGSILGESQTLGRSGTAGAWTASANADAHSPHSTPRPFKLVITGPLSGPGTLSAGASSVNPGAVTASRARKASQLQAAERTEVEAALDGVAAALASALALGQLSSLGVCEVCEWAPRHSRVLAEGVAQGVDPRPRTAAGEAAVASPGSRSKGRAWASQGISMGISQGRGSDAEAAGFGAVRCAGATVKALELKGLAAGGGAAVSALLSALCLGIDLVDPAAAAAAADASSPAVEHRYLATAGSEWLQALVTHVGSRPPTRGLALPPLFVALPKDSPKDMSKDSPKDLSEDRASAPLDRDVGDSTVSISGLMGGWLRATEADRLRDAAMLQDRPPLLLASLVLDDTRLGDCAATAHAIAALVRSGAGLGASSSAHPSSPQLPGGRCALRTLGLARCGLGPTFVAVLAGALEAAPPAGPTSSAGSPSRPAASGIKVSAEWLELLGDMGGAGDKPEDDRSGGGGGRVGSLEALWLNGNPRIGDGGAEELAAALRRAPASSQGAALESLDLSHCGLGDRGALALAAALLEPSPGPSPGGGGGGGGGGDGRLPCPRLRSLVLAGNAGVADAAAVRLGMVAADRAQGTMSVSGLRRRPELDADYHKRLAAFGLAVPNTAPLPLTDQSGGGPRGGKPDWLAATTGKWASAGSVFDPHGDASGRYEESLGAWEAEPSDASSKAWRALLAIDPSVRAAASRRHGTDNWKFSLSVRQRLALARGAFAPAAVASEAPAPSRASRPRGPKPSYGDLVELGVAAVRGRAPLLSVNLDGCGVSARVASLQGAASFSGSLLGAATLSLPLSPARLTALLRRGAGTSAFGGPDDYDDDDLLDGCAVPPGKTHAQVETKAFHVDDAPRGMTGALGMHRRQRS